MNLPEQVHKQTIGFDHFATSFNSSDRISLSKDGRFAPVVSLERANMPTRDLVLTGTELSNSFKQISKLLQTSTRALNDLEPHLSFLESQTRQTLLTAGYVLQAVSVTILIVAPSLAIATLPITLAGLYIIKQAMFPKLSTKTTNAIQQLCNNQSEFRNSFTDPLNLKEVAGNKTKPTAAFYFFTMATAVIPDYVSEKQGDFANTIKNIALLLSITDIPKPQNGVSRAFVLSALSTLNRKKILEAMQKTKQLTDYAARFTLNGFPEDANNFGQGFIELTEHFANLAKKR